VSSDRWIARIVGALFIVGTATAVAGGTLLLPMEDAAYLTEVAAAEGRMVSGFFLEFILVLSLFGIGIFMYPVLRRRSEPMALGYLASRTLEAVILLAGAISGLLILSVSRSYSDVTAAEQVGDMLIAGREWTLLLGGLVALGISALILNSLLYMAELIPKWLSMWGFIAGAVILVRGVIEAYGVEFSGALQAMFAAPIAIQEMVFAVRLIWKGFDSPSVDADLRTDARRRELV
jgi:hypothetical protein